MMVMGVVPARADVLVEYLFWNEMGKQVGQAIKSHEEYRAERQLWKDNIAAAKQELEACGGCAEAQAKLDKWQGIENKFQDVAGSLAVAGKMPPALAQWLDIDMPLTPGRTEAQRQEACGIVRRPQAEGTPPQCVAAYNTYIDCLEEQQQLNGFCNWRRARNIGGACWDKFKLRNHSAAGNMAGFEREQELQAARTAGAIIPEYEAGTYPIVYYGRVPDDFHPDIPPRDVLVERLAQKGDNFEVRISFTMSKRSAGTLNEVAFLNFHHSEAAAFTKCFSLDRPTDEVGRRICDDLVDLWQFYEERTLMICSYQGQEASHMPPYLYWFGARPEGAAPERLLSRSHNHPVLSIAGIRDNCPATRGDADEVEAAWSEQLASLRTAHPEQPASVRMPRPDWIQKQIDERQARHDANYARLQEGKKALASFPVQGRYRLENPHGTTVRTADCVLVSAGFEAKYAISCAFEGRTINAGITHVASVGAFMINSNLGDVPTQGSYVVDLAHREEGKGDALIKYGSSSNTSVLKLVRTGNLTPLLAFPLEGKYALEIVGDASSVTGDCQAVTDARYQPPRFDFDCTMSDGSNTRSEGVLNAANAVSMHFVGWFPRQYVLDGTQIDGLFLRVVDGFDAKTPSTAVLTGGNDRGIRATFIRTGDLTGPTLSSTAETPKKQRETLASKMDAPAAPTPATTTPTADVQHTPVRGGVSQSGALRAQIVSVQTYSDGIRVQFKAGGRGMAAPDSSCLRSKDGATKVSPSAINLKVNKPGQYFGTIDFPLSAPGEWYFQYACAEEYSLALVAK